MKKLSFGILIILVCLLSYQSLLSLILTAPAGEVWDKSDGTFSHGRVVSVTNIGYTDEIGSEANSVTITCDPDPTICWEISADGKDISIGLVAGGNPINPTIHHKYTIPEL